MPDLTFKVCLLGAVAVGKSAIANRLQSHTFDEDYQPTIGAGYIPFRMKVDGKEVELQIWDTAGMERYKSLGSIYYRDACAAIFVYDQTSLQSSDALQTWYDCFRATVKNECYIAVAANKDDLANKVVPNDKIKAWCTEKGFEFFITSAKTGTGVTEMFAALARGVMSMSRFVETTNNVPKKADNSSGCC